MARSEGSVGDGGQSLVEFALVLPVLLVVLTGIFTFGIALNQYMVLTNATNAAARAFALSRGQKTPALAASDPCGYAASVLQGAASNLAQRSLSVTVAYTTAAGTTTTYNNAQSCSPSILNAGDAVQVTATYPVAPLLFGWTSQTYTLTARSTELMQ